MAESSFHLMEESLKAFLIDAQSDRHNSRNANFYKYNNLKIFMDPKKNQIPHFIIRIGISESIYKLENGEIISGGLGADERFVKRWIARYWKRLDFGNSWKEAKKVKTVKFNKDGTVAEDTDSVGG